MSRENTEMLIWLMGTKDHKSMLNMVYDGEQVGCPEKIGNVNMAYGNKGS
jgi:hypothetical protein